MSQRHLEAKVVHFKTKCHDLHAENRHLRQRIKWLESSREAHKQKHKDFREQSKSHKSKVGSESGQGRNHDIGGHKYGSTLVSLCVSLYILAGCSFRGVNRVLGCLKSEYGVIRGAILSKSSIENWVQKLGYYQYTHYGENLYEGDYGLIIDECMVIGQERLMVVLGIDAVKTGTEATVMEDVRLLAIAVKKSWKAEDVQELFEEVQKKIGKRAAYLICDGGNNLIKGSKLFDISRICDVGHEVAKCVEQVYKNEDVFKAFQKDMAMLKFREVMKETAYLLPPKQRTIARFMNLSTGVTWAQQILKAMPKLTVIEQQTFACVLTYKELIEELAQVFEMVNPILKLLKNEGISFENIDKSIKICQKYAVKTLPVGIENAIANTTESRLEKLVEKITQYLNKERLKIPNAQTVWHASSDVIESLFGKYKSTKADNPLYGVTPLVLSLCVHTNWNDDKEERRLDIKNALQSVSMADLNTWKNEHLIENQVVRRKKVLRK